MTDSMQRREFFRQLGAAVVVGGLASSSQSEKHYDFPAPHGWTDPYGPEYYRVEQEAFDAVTSRITIVWNPAVRL